MIPRAAPLMPMLMLCGCAGPDVSLDAVRSPRSLEVPAATPASAAPPRPFVRIREPRAEDSGASVTLNLRDATLIECLTRADPNLNVVPTTPEVDLDRRYSVRVNDLSLRQYLEILQGMTGYALELDPEHPIVHVSSYLTRSWDVSTFASHGQAKLKVGQAVSLSSSSSTGGEGGEGGEGERDEESEEGSATVTYDHTDSPWEDLLANARLILGLSGAKATPARSPSPQTWLVADQRLGLLRARGPVPRVR